MFNVYHKLWNGARYLLLFVVCAAGLVAFVSSETAYLANESASIYLPLLGTGSADDPADNPDADGGDDPDGDPATIADAVVFVSRQIPKYGSIYWDEPNAMPGVGPYDRFRVAAPGNLVIREPDGTLRTLVDGATPTADSLDLIDVNAPNVSYDGETIVFAGLPAGDYSDDPLKNPGTWRIYAIAVDGSDLRQITTSDRDVDMDQFADAAGSLSPYDDTDPAWLPDGRIVFSSTRWPSFGQYGGVRTSNLYLVDADGDNLHRITSERNGADRPLVDPITGKIVYARWWRNHRFALDSLETVEHSKRGYEQKDGLSSVRGRQMSGDAKYKDYLWRNAWHAAAINPDGTDLEMWGGAGRSDVDNQVYGGAFTPEGELVANFFPMLNLTEASGFGGLRRYQRGPGSYTPLIGITGNTGDPVHKENPTSYGVNNGAYAADPAVLSDGRLVISWAPDYRQDYGLYVINADGSGLQPLHDEDDTTELRARVVAARPLPPVITDTVDAQPSLLPPADDSYDQDGTFVFDALNVYANAPVDTDIVSAPAVGSAQTMRFFIDHQRTRAGSFSNLDWPILLNELSVAPDGSAREPNAPADVPLFEQLRSSEGRVPLTGGPEPDGAAHVTGLNFGRPGTTMRCVGCHAGHTMMAVPENSEEAQWSNLAPGAEVRVSSARDEKYNKGLIDRRVMNGPIRDYWTSAPDAVEGQWIELHFPVPVSVRTVRLYNPRPGDEADSSIVVQDATVRLFGDADGTAEVASASTRELSEWGNDVAFDDVKAQVVRIEIDSVEGTFDGKRVASLAEIEVIARGEER